MPTTTPGRPKLGADGKRVKTFVLDTKVSVELIDFFGEMTPWG